jgi:hypothetical protein
MNDIQRARDYANQQQFKADIQNFYETHNYNIEGEEAKETQFGCAGDDRSGGSGVAEVSGEHFGTPTVLLV